MMQRRGFEKAADVSLLQRWGSSLLTLVVIFGLAACGKLFESTCAEDDRECLAGGVLRSNKPCARNGDCALGLDCIDQVCTYTEQTAQGEKCIVSAECRQGLYCAVENLACAPINLTQEADGSCSSSSECARDAVCDTNGGELFSKGPYSQIPDECHQELQSASTPEHCKLPRKCVTRGTADLGSVCRDNGDCLPGLYCIPDPLDSDKSICYGGIKLKAEPVSFPLWGGVKCPLDATTPVAYFEVPRASGGTSDFYRLPFPNDLRQTDAGIDLTGHPLPTASLTPQTAQRFITESAHLQGFSTHPTVYFRFSQTPRTEDLSPGTLHIVDISPDSPEYAQEDGIEWLASDHRGNYICANWLALQRPLGAPLRSQTTYVAFVTKAVHTNADKDFERSPDLDALLTSERPQDATLAQAWERYAPLRDYLSSGRASVSEDDILTAAVFTTQDATGIVPKLREAVEAAARDDSEALSLSDVTECQADATSACDVSARTACADHDPRTLFRELRGQVRLPAFQTGQAPYATPEDGGDLPLDGSRPQVQGYPKVCFALSLPKTSQPNTRLPLLIVAHANGGSFSDPMVRAGLADWAATLPVPSAVLSIEMPVHGTRRGSSTQAPQDLFLNLINPKAARGNVLQGAADLISLTLLAERGITAADSATGEAIQFDPSRVVLYGQDQGAQHAALMLGSEPRVRAAVLAAIGGHSASRLLTQQKPLAMSKVLAFLLFDPDLSDGRLAGEKFNPVLAFLQSYMDSADPINYARQLKLSPPSTAADGHDVFMTYGLDDGFTSEANQTAYARAARLSVVTPNRSSDDFPEVAAPARGNAMVGTQRRSIAFVTYDPAEDAAQVKSPLDGHFVDVATARGLSDVRGFLADALQGKTPEIGGH